ncbi:MAG: hypothetical protein IJN38_05940 [Clostridia bacterium]|nr:hypothetical protein [Clostridia bacterium]
MTLDEFITYRNIKVKDNEHRKVIELFYPYLRSVSGDERLLPAILEKYIGVNLSGVCVVTACFNGVNDGAIPPCDDVDLYIKLSNGVKVFVYGRETQDLKQSNKDEYVIKLNKL